jgi:hypothetical protein
MIEYLLLDPLEVPLCPVGLWPATIVSQKELGQLVPGTKLSAFRIFT